MFTPTLLGLLLIVECALAVHQSTLPLNADTIKIKVEQLIASGFQTADIVPRRCNTDEDGHSCCVVDRGVIDLKGTPGFEAMLAPHRFRYFGCEGSCKAPMVLDMFSSKVIHEKSCKPVGWSALKFIYKGEDKNIFIAKAEKFFVNKCSCS